MDTAKVDETIRQEIVHELHCVPGLEPGSVVVKVEGGAVTLTGHVARNPIRRAAEELARRVPGVRSVADEIQVEHHRDDNQKEASLVRAVVEAFGQGHKVGH